MSENQATFDLPLAAWILTVTIGIALLTVGTLGVIHYNDIDDRRTWCNLYIIIGLGTLLFAVLYALNS